MCVWPKPHVNKWEINEAQPNMESRINPTFARTRQSAKGSYDESTTHRCLCIPHTATRQHCSVNGELGGEEREGAMDILQTSQELLIGLDGKGLVERSGPTIEDPGDPMAPHPADTAACGKAAQALLG